MKVLKTVAEVATIVFTMIIVAVADVTGKVSRTMTDLSPE
mgnify:CR=1 FL=1